MYSHSKSFDYIPTKPVRQRDNVALTNEAHLDIISNYRFTMQINERVNMLVTDEVRSYIGLSTKAEFACDAVESGAVRRYAQAIMDEDPAYLGETNDANRRFGGPVAPPLFANHMLRRPLGTPDPIQDNAQNPLFDGIVPVANLPAIRPLANLASLNGGSEFEFFRYARHGERVSVKLSYADITEKASSKGPMVLVVRLYEFMTGDGELLMRSKNTTIRR